MKKFRFFDWTLTLMAVGSVLGLIRMLASRAPGDEAIVPVACFGLCLIGVLYLLIEGIRIASPLFSFVAGIVLSSAALPVPLIVLEGFELRFLLLAAFALVPAAIFGALFAWCERRLRSKWKWVVRAVPALTCAMITVALTKFT